MISLPEHQPVLMRTRSKYNFADPGKGVVSFLHVRRYNLVFLTVQSSPGEDRNWVSSFCPALQLCLHSCLKLGSDKFKGFRGVYKPTD